MRTPARSIFSFLFVFLFSALFSALHAQANSGVVSGVVTDPSGLIVHLAIVGGVVIMFDVARPLLASSRNSGPNS